MSTSVRVRVISGVAASVTGQSAVTSVAGRTGAVTLTVADVSGAQAETASSIGTLISGAASKATPGNADGIAISDSAASGILKNLSWSNLKAEISASLDGIFAKLAGLAGGQTLIGGTAASENLTLQSTAHATRGKLLLGASSAYDEVNVRLGIGTQSPSSKLHVVGTTEQKRIGYDLSNYCATTVGSTGKVTYEANGVTHTFKGGTGTATISANMVANGTFTSDISGWTDSGSSWSWSSGAALHTAGSASTLSQALTTTSGALYMVAFVLTRSAGSISVSVGGDTIYIQGAETAFIAGTEYKRGFVASGNSSAGIVITPSSDFAGTVDNVRLYSITAGSLAPSLAILESTGATQVELRASAPASGNTQVGINGLFSNVGATNTAVFGADCGRSIISGTNNALSGPNAAYSAINPMESVIHGAAAAYGLINPYLITAIGRSAARYLANGSTIAVTAATSCYFGANTKVSADGVTNENVFGYNATGIGSNSCVIGSSAVTKCQIFGDVILDKTITAAGTTGAQTINKTCGSVNFAASATSLVVTNNRVTTSSVIVATVATNDTTMKSVQVVAASGSFTLYASAAATAETRVNWIVIN